MTVPEEERVSTAISKLVRLVQERPLVFPVEAEGIAWMASAWLVRLARLMEAAAELYSLGFSSESAPLVRSCMEHAAAIHWLIENADSSVQAVLVSYEDHRSRLAKEFEGLGWGEFGSGSPNEDKGAQKSIRFPKYKDLCAATGIEGLYSSFRLESALSHPTYSSGKVYWREVGGEWALHFDDPEPGVDLVWIVVLFYLGALALDGLNPDPAFLNGLKQINKELGLALVED